MHAERVPWSIYVYTKFGVDSSSQINLLTTLIERGHTNTVTADASDGVMGNFARPDKPPRAQA